MGDVLDADYIVVGAGAVGMAFTDALIDHADVSVAMVDVSARSLKNYPLADVPWAAPGSRIVAIARDVEIDILPTAEVLIWTSGRDRARRA